VSVNYNVATINARLNDVIAQIGAVGNLILSDVGNVDLVTIPLAPGVGTVAAGVLNFTTPVTGIVTIGGVPTQARVVSGSSTIISGLTVSSGAGTDIFIAPLPLIGGQAVTFSSGSIIGR